MSNFKLTRPPFDPAKDLWVIGCIGWHGAISARVDDGTFPHHQEGEMKGKRWRFHIRSQQFTETLGSFYDLTRDEKDAVCEWLQRRGYKKSGEIIL